MKKLIITAAIALTATFSFFTYQSKAVSTSSPVALQKTAQNNQADFNPVKTDKMDLAQAD